jgi:hypothetical protein
MVTSKPAKSGHFQIGVNILSAEFIIQAPFFIFKPYNDVRHRRRVAAERLSRVRVNEMASSLSLQ